MFKFELDDVVKIPFNGKIVELYTFPFVDACGIRYRFNKEGIYPLG